MSRRSTKQRRAAMRRAWAQWSALFRRRLRDDPDFRMKSIFWRWGPTLRRLADS
jgi:hypothetical protein